MYGIPTQTGRFKDREYDHIVPSSRYTHMKINLFYKLFVTYVVIALVAVIIINLQMGTHIKATIQERIEQNLLTNSHLITLTSSLADLEKTVDRIAAIADARATLITADGRVVYDSETTTVEMDNHLNRTEIQEARVRGKGSAIRFSQTLRIDTLYVAMPILQGNTIEGYIRLARPLTEVKQSIHELNIVLLQSFLFVGALSFLIAFIFSARFVSPIQEMEQFTTRLREGEMPGTLLINSADERGRLARNINHLVTELKEKIGQAQEEKGKLEAAFASMTDGVLVLNNAGAIESANASFTRMFSLNYGDIVGKTPLDAFRNIDLQKALDRFRENGVPLSQEISLEEGDIGAVDVTISPIRGLPRNDEKTMLVFHDVTRLKKLEKMRGDFVANVTHEIKTPLTAILGFIETLKDGAIEEKEVAHQFLQIIHTHAQRLNRLVDDLLTISNMELGETELSFEDLSLISVIESILPIIEQQATKKDIVVKKELPDQLPLIKGDRDKVMQILLNVLDNAVKFTDREGTVSITAHDNEDGRVAVRISDTGIGIPKAEIPRLGERFYRVDKTRSREMGGTGLGLSIVKHLLIAHGGSMSIDSRPGRGTSVSIFFPFRVI